MFEYGMVYLQFPIPVDATKNLGTQKGARCLDSSLAGYHFACLPEPEPVLYLYLVIWSSSHSITIYSYSTSLTHSKKSNTKVS